MIIGRRGASAAAISYSLLASKKARGRAGLRELQTDSKLTPEEVHLRRGGDDAASLYIADSMGWEATRVVDLRLCFFRGDTGGHKGGAGFFRQMFRQTTGDAIVVCRGVSGARARGTLGLRGDPLATTDHNGGPILAI